MQRRPVTAPNPLEFHEYRRRRIAGQGQDDQQVSRPRLRGAGLLWPCPRPAAQGRLGRSGRTISRMLWEVDAKSNQAPQRHRPGAQGRRQADPRHRPRPRGRGDLLARAGGAEGKEGAQGPDGRARGVQRHHQAGGDRGDEASARDRRARWSTPISRAARSIISSASRSRRCCGASCRARARPAACSRWRCGWSCDRELEIEKFVAARILVDRRHARDAAQRHLRGAPRRRRRQEDPAPRHRLGRGSRSLHARSRERAASPSPRSRPSRRGAIRRRPSPPRRCSRRRAASSASRPRAPCGSRSGSTKASRSTARPSASSPICAPTASTWRRRRSPTIRAHDRQAITARNTCRTRRAHTTNKSKNAQEAHEAMRPTDRRPHARARSPNTSTAIRPGSTS